MDNENIKTDINIKVKNKKHKSRAQSIGEEISNSVSHGVGALLAVAALVICTVRAVRYGSPIGVVSAVLFGTTLILLYIFSSLYHSLTHKKAKYVFRVFDHCSIFLLIFGTYIPISLVVIGGALGWVLFGLNAMCMTVGIIFNAISLERWVKASMVLYIIMGWSVIISIVSVVRALPPTGIVFLFVGGASYMLGIIFYSKKFRYTHFIWHLFVLGGSIMHFFLIAFYCYPKI